MGIVIRLLLLLAAALALGGRAEAQGDCRRYAQIMVDLGKGRDVTSDDISWSMGIERNRTCANVTPASAAAIAAGAPAQVPAPPPVRYAAPLPAAPANVSLMSGQAGCTPSPRLDPQSSNPCDWFMLALAHQRGDGVPRDHPRSLHFLERAAKAGHATAQLGLGEAYGSGFGGLRADPRAAFHWTLLAAQQRHPTAANILGHYLLKGVGAPADPRAAADWFQKALDGGHLDAAVDLGILYSKGNGVPRDPVRATRYWELAAEKGVTDAQYYLGDAYRMGVGVPFDTGRARFWLRKAHAGGDKDAARILAYMDEVDRRYASMPAVTSSASRGAGSSGPSLSEQAMETHRRQARENCEAALKGANRRCSLPN